MRRTRLLRARWRLPVLASIAEAMILLSAAACQALPPPAYLSVYGAPTYTLDTGEYLWGSVGGVNNAGTAVGTVHFFESFSFDDGSGSTLRATRPVRWGGAGTPATELDIFGPEPPGGHCCNAALAINDAGTAVGYAALKLDSAGNFVASPAVRWDASGTAATELGVNGTNLFAATAAIDINASGTALGFASPQRAYGDGNRAVRWDASGTATELGHIGTDARGYTQIFPAAINDSGTAVGSAYTYDCSNIEMDGCRWLGERAVRWDAAGTAATELGHLGTDPLGATNDRATAINNAGTAIGNATVGVDFPDGGRGLVPRPVRWSAAGTAATELGNLGTDSSGYWLGWAAGINQAGTAAGNAEKYDGAGNYLGTRAVLWHASGTAATELGILGTHLSGISASGANAINAAGAVVGWAFEYDELGELVGQRAVYWQTDGTAVDLNSLVDPASGWLLTDATAISDTGWIAGTGEFDPDGPGGQSSYIRMYVIHVPATAIPEPSTPVLFASAVLALCLLLTRREYGWSFAPRVLVATCIVLLASATSASAAMFSATNVAELIAAIDAANQNAEPDSIALAAGATFTLTDANNSTSGPTGLPTITASENLTIFGNGGVIERSAIAGTPSFRLFDVAVGASLAVENLTLQRGRNSHGGAVHNQGSLTLTGVTLQDNVAVGPQWAGTARGGGIYSSGTLTIEGSILQNNQAIGGPGEPGHCVGGGCGNGFPGGHGFGGGLYLSGTTTLINVTLSANTARGGNGGRGHSWHDRGGTFGSDGGRGGDGFGGGLYAAAGAVTLLNTSATGNTAQHGNGGLGGTGQGGQPGAPGVGRGGGLKTNSMTSLDEFTVAHITSNTASTSNPNIYGSYQVIVNPNPLPGDFNGDGTVDAADYIIWRTNGGTPEEFNIWRANFGITAGGGAGSLAADNPNEAVPEPSTMAMLLVLFLSLCVRRSGGLYSKS